MNDKTLERYKRIWQTVSKVPSGTVSTYGQIAETAGFTRGARLVGTALKNLPKNSTVPWHRILNAQGRLSFPKSSKQYQTQRSRLIGEGIVFVNEKVNLGQFGWQEDLDAMLWRPD